MAAEKKTRLADYDLVVENSPHFFEPWTSQWKMLQVVIALMFPLIASTLIFGLQVLAHAVVGVIVAVISEYLYERIVRNRFTIDDLSAVVTGLLVGMSMPSGSSLVSTAILSFIAIVVFKMIPGGMGANRFNPAVAARVLYLLFPWFWNGYIAGVGTPDAVATASYATAIYPKGPGTELTVDALAQATPLFYLSWGHTSVPAEAPQTLWELFLGNQGGWGGALGEVSTIAILLAMIYLILRRIISPYTSILFIGTVFIYMFVYGGFDTEFALYHILSGAVFFAGTFMVTDYSTSGLTPVSRIVFPIGAGLITAAFRTGGFAPEGVGISIVIMNAVISYVDRMTMPRIYGHKKNPFLGFGFDDREPRKKKDILAETK